MNTPVTLHYSQTELPDVETIVAKLDGYSPKTVSRSDRHVITWEEKMKPLTATVTFDDGQTDVKVTTLDSRKSFRSLMVKHGIRHLSQD